MVSSSNQSFLANWDLDISLKTSCRINGLISLPNVFIPHLTVWWGTKPGRERKKMVENGGEKKVEIAHTHIQKTPKQTHRSQLTWTPKCQEKLQLPNTLKITAIASPMVTALSSTKQFHALQLHHGGKKVTVSLGNILSGTKWKPAWATIRELLPFKVT